MVALQRVLQRRHERLPVSGHGRYAAAVDVDVLEDEDLRHPARETSRPAREVPLVRRFRRVALEERDRPAVGEELELQDVRVGSFEGRRTGAIYGWLTKQSKFVRGLMPTQDRRRAEGVRN